MAVTGLIMIGFLLMHMYGNLKVFQGQAAYDSYAEFLKEDVLYPIMPHGTFIWVFRIFLLLAVVLHIWSAVALTQQTLKVRGHGNHNTKRQVQTYAARTMRWGGVIILGFIIFHLLQFTARLVTPGFDKDLHGAYEMYVLSFQQWWMVLLYAVLIAIVCMHIRHGFWSAFATLGMNTSAAARRNLNILAVFVAVLLYVGFMAPPVAVLTGWVHV